MEPHSNGLSSGTFSSNQYGVVGGGVMGLQITQELLEKGESQVILVTNRASSDNAGEIVGTLTHRLKKAHDAETVNRLIGNVTITDDYNQLCRCNLIIETSTEDLETKQRILKNISDVVSPNSIIATNTSALSINTLSNSVSRPERFLGIHFFNPVRKMELVEIIRGSSTSDDVVNTSADWITRIGKRPIVVNDYPGFIVNRLLLPQINNAIKMVENSDLNPKDVDTALKYGLNHPMGPFELADYIGLDVCLRILNEMFSASEDSNYRPAQTLVDKVKEGRLGIKTKGGFYDY